MCLYRQQHQQLRREDAQKHGERVDRRIAHVGQLAAFGRHSVGEGKGRRVGMRAADEAHQCVVVHFKN